MLFLVISSTRYKNIFFTRGFVGILASIYLKLFSNNLFIREVHAAPGEYKVLQGNSLKKFLIFVYEKTSFFIDSLADLRIFNHPNLENFYKQNGVFNEYDLTLYNGASIKEDSMSVQEAREMLGLELNKTILVFTGSVSSWHGIEDLVALQDEFEKKYDNIQIVVGGGEIPKEHKHKIINLYPLDEIGCNNLIIASDACLLPIKNNRISPGSPLKLYQYLLSSKPVITQQDVVGYADEVKKFDAGLIVNFHKPSETRVKIKEFIKNIEHISADLKLNKLDMKITWDDRVNEIQKSIYNHRKLK